MDSKTIQDKLFAKVSSTIMNEVRPEDNLRILGYDSILGLELLSFIESTFHVSLEFEDLMTLKLSGLVQKIADGQN